MVQVYYLFVGDVYGRRQMTEWRKIEKYEKGVWILCKMRDLKDGDLFRMFEGDGKTFTWCGHKDFYAISAPFPVAEPEGNWGIEAL
jgi:hypothetical protein